jgi:hypothetical protein
MRHLALLFAVLVFAASATAGPDALDSALSSIQLSRADFHVDSEVLLTRNASTAHRLLIFDQWFQHPLRIPFWERHIRTTLLQSEGQLHPLFNSCASIISMGTRRDLIPPTPADKYRATAAQTDALSAAIHSLDPSARVSNVSSVPPRVQELAAMLLFAMHDALEWRQMALRDIPADSLPNLFASLSQPLERSSRDTTARADTLFPDNYASFYRQQDLLDKVDLRLLFSAADDLTAVTDTVATELAALPDASSFDFRCRTRYGWIRLSSGGDQSYADTMLLCLDLSGSDTYRSGGGTLDARHPLSIMLDVRGDDRYESSNVPAFGCGILGYGILVDAAGNDTYKSSGYHTEGCGLAGVGLLSDRAGNDTYDALGAAQGFGLFGVGVLSDNNGDDSYHSYCESQGCGMTNGIGLLLDLVGNDGYTADDADIIFPSSQSDKHNSSMCQGAGYGMRRDYLDAHSLGGGVGMLLDRAGNDSYSGGVFSQAVGYWYGIGILDDRAGNDHYNAVWYGQSATAHMGISYLDDASGDDVYTATMSVSAGAAHDFSVSLFVDEAGNDSYFQAANALGRSLNSSVALFADFTGDDHYEGKESLGQSVNFSATGLRAEILTTAVFLDLDGSDTYPDGMESNNSSWIQKSAAPLPLLKGIGLDGTQLKVSWDESDR